MIAVYKHFDSDIESIIGWQSICISTSLTLTYLAEHFNVLWKENWTLEAGRVLKAFEKDVINKVMSD